jgi:hypothetical protein
MSEKIETTKFDVLPSGVQMTMAVSEFFQKNGGHGGYCYVCFPWVDIKTQWHAFSLFENPVNPQERQIFLQKAGDWTCKVHAILQRDTVHPAWIQGPFPGPYASAEEYDNQILVASGIDGITPALSVIRAQKDSRRINLIWTVRDRHLLSFFLFVTCILTTRGGISFSIPEVNRLRILRSRFSRIPMSVLSLDDVQSSNKP